VAVGQAPPADMMRLITASAAEETIATSVSTALELEGSGRALSEQSCTGVSQPESSAGSPDAGCAEAELHVAELIPGIKARLVMLRLRTGVLEGMVEQASAKFDALVEQATANRVSVIERAEEALAALGPGIGVSGKRHIDAHARETVDMCEVMIARADAECASAIDRAEAERATVLEQPIAELNSARAEVTAAESELDEAVNAPVSGCRDPTEWLPDELVVMIMEWLPLWNGVCERVCQRWARLAESAPLRRRKRDERWAAYAAGLITPHSLVSECILNSYRAENMNSVNALAVGANGKTYLGSSDGTIRVLWPADSGVDLNTLEGHTKSVTALAVGMDGKVYSGSWDESIRVWSGVDGAHLQTLVGHTNRVLALAVGLGGEVFSGSYDRTIRVWSGDDGTHLRTLEGHADVVCSLAVGLDGKVYSGSFDKTIRVWSGEDGTHLHTLMGHTSIVSALCVGKSNTVYSASYDTTIRVWSGEDGTHLRTLLWPGNCVEAIAVGLDGRLYVSAEQEIGIWRCSDGKHLHTLRGSVLIQALVMMPNGRLLSGGSVPLVNSDDDEEEEEEDEDDDGDDAEDDDDEENGDDAECDADANVTFGAVLQEW
jgi:hypothetical protein